MKHSMATSRSYDKQFRMESIYEIKYLHYCNHLSFSNLLQRESPPEPLPYSVT